MNFLRKSNFVCKVKKGLSVVPKGSSTVQSTKTLVEFKSKTHVFR